MKKDNMDQLEALILNRARRELVPAPADRQALWSGLLAKMEVSALVARGADSMGPPSPRVGGGTPNGGVVPNGSGVPNGGVVPNGSSVPNGSVTFPESGAGLPMTSSAPAAVARGGLRAFALGGLGGLLIGFGAGYGASSLSKSAHSPPREGPRLEIVQTAKPVPPRLGPAPDLSQKAMEGLAPSGTTPERMVPLTQGSSKKSVSFGSEGEDKDVVPAVRRPFYEELAYLRRAQAALKAGNGALALGLMQSLDELVPKGALLSERAVTRVLALCQLGRSDEATSIAHRLLADPQASVYAERLAASCAQPTNPGAKH